MELKFISFSRYFNAIFRLENNIYIYFDYKNRYI